MAIPTASVLTQAGSTTNTTPYTTASVTLTAGRLYLVAVVSTGTAPLADPTGVQTTGGAIVFTKAVAGRGFNTGASAAKTVTWWWAVAGSTVTATIAISTPASPTGCAWTVIEVLQASPTTPIVTTSSNFADAATSVTITPAALASANNLLIAAWGGSLNVTTDVPSGTNWAALGAGATFNTPATFIECATNGGGASTQLTCSGAGSAARGVQVLEIASIPVLPTRQAGIVRIVQRALSSARRKFKRKGFVRLSYVSLTPITGAQFGASLTGAATVTAALATAINLSAALTGAATVPSPSLATGISLSSVVTGAATVTAPLSTAIPLAAVVTGAATVTAPLTTAIRLAAAVTGTATVTADLTGGGAAGPARKARLVVINERVRRSHVRAGISRARTRQRLAPTFAVAYQSPPVPAQFAVTLSAAATTVANLTTGIRLGSAITGAATVAAALTTAIQMSAAVTGTATVTAPLTTGAAGLAAALLGTATVTAPLSTAIRLAGAVSGTATVVAPLSSVPILLAAVLNTAATVSAPLLTGIRFATALSATATVTTAITTAVRLAAVLNATASITAPLSNELQQLFTGILNVLAVHSAALSVTSVSRGTVVIHSVHTAMLTINPQPT